jgi:CRP-like cAMP-binding protein
MERESLTKARTFFLNLLGEEDDVIVKRAGEKIVNVGRPGKVMYMIKSGSATIQLFDGKETVALVPGDLIGLMGTIDGRDYYDSTVAATDCELVALDKARIEFMLHEHPTFATHIMKIMIDRFYFVMGLAKKSYCTE